MAKEKKNLPALLRSVPPDKITKQQILALISTETVRWNYNKMLQGLNSMKITKDNLKESYPELKEADNFIKSITEWRKEQSRPFSEVDMLFLEVAKEIIAPVLEATTSIKSQVKIASEANAAEIAQAKKEKDRRDLITSTLASFINQVTSDIMLATTDNQIVLIQKRIGSEKSKKGFYAEYWQELVDKCEALNSTINEQKNKIRELTELNSELEKALKSNDDSKAVDIKEQIELTNYELMENSIRLQERAFEQSINISIVEVGQPDVSVAKSRTTRWKWRVDDIDVLRKKSPLLTKIVPDEVKIEQFMKEKRDEGLFKTNEPELYMGGITFYKEKYY
jgi:hypothetical protein